MRGKVTVYDATGKKITESDNMLVFDCARVVIKALGGLEDERAAIVRFGDVGTATDRMDTGLHGNVLFVKDTENIEVLSWDRVRINFWLDPWEAPGVTIREVGLFSRTRDEMLARVVISGGVVHGGERLVFSWEYYYEL